MTLPKETAAGPFEGSDRNDEKNKSDESAEREVVLSLAAGAKSASRLLAQSQLAVRNQAIFYFSETLLDHKDQILSANQKDRACADPKDPLTKRLTFDESKLAVVVDGLRALVAMEDPLGKIDLARELEKDLNLYRVPS